MHDIEIGQDAPEAVYLGVVSVGFRGDEEDDAQEHRYSKCRDQGVRLDVEAREAVAAGDVREDPGREVIELREVWLDRLGEVGALFEGEGCWEGHGVGAQSTLLEQQWVVFFRPFVLKWWFESSKRTDWHGSRRSMPSHPRHVFASARRTAPQRPSLR